MPLTFSNFPTSAISRQPEVFDPLAASISVQEEDIFFGVARVALVAVLLAGPLALGAVQAWAWGGMCVATLLVLLLWAVGCLRAGKVRLVWSPLYIPGVALLILALVQWRANLTADQVGTREAAIKLAMCLVIFFLVQHLFAEVPAIVLRTAAAITAYALVIALFAIIQSFAAPGLIYGVIQPRGGGGIYGSYINDNHYAGLMEMLVPLTVAFALTLYPRHPAKPLVLFATCVSLASVYLSGSRGGGIAVLIELVVFGIIIFLAGSIRDRNRLLIVALLVVALAGVSFAWLDPGHIGPRWEQMTNRPRLALGMRNTMTADSLRMTRDHFAYGVGLGAFSAAYTKYQTIATDLLVDHAHNDYVELFAETGIAGCFVALVAVALFLWCACRSLRRRLLEPVGWLYLGAALGVCGILVHSFSDFNLHIPANAAWFAACIGLATLPATADA